jgi:hypothetical protein
VVVLELALVLYRVVRAVAAADVVVVRAVGVEGVEVLAAAVFDEGSGVVPDDFDDLDRRRRSVSVTQGEVNT